MNKKIKIMLVFALVLSINFSIFAEEETGKQEETDEIIEVIQEDILEEDISEEEIESHQSLETEDPKNKTLEIEVNPKDAKEKVETSKKVDRDTPKANEIEENEKKSNSNEEIQNKGVISVKTWEEYVSAYNDESVKEIKMTTNIVANKNFPINRRVSSLLIDGNNFILDAKELGETLFKLDMEESSEERGYF